MIFRIVSSSLNYYSYIISNVQYNFNDENVYNFCAARKQIKRSSPSLEDQQLEVVKKLKANFSPPERKHSKESSPKNSKKTPKRTNCLDKFVCKYLYKVKILFLKY